MRSTRVSTRRLLTQGVVCGLATLALACWPVRSSLVELRFVDPGAEELVPVERAVAVLHPIGDYEVEGVVRFEARSSVPQVERGLRVRAQVSGLPGQRPGQRHAFHVHLLGDCGGEGGQRAGTHFNFAGPSREPPADIERITGNLGELEPNADGEAQYEAEIEAARLYGPFSILGRSVIVHARGNDEDQPPIGAAGERLACGVIGIAD